MTPVTAIVLHYRSWEDTLTCVESLFALEDRTGLSVMVVVNGNDGVEGVPSLRARFPEVEVVALPQNRGFAGGMNAGMRAAMAHHPAFLWLLNNDVWVEHDALSALKDAARAQPRVGMWGAVITNWEAPHAVQAWGAGQIHRLLGVTTLYTQLPKRLSTDDYVVGASLFVRAEALHPVGLLDEGFFLYFEDTDWSLRMQQAGWALGVAENARIRHKVGAASGGVSAKTDVHMNRSAVRFWRRHAASGWAWVPILAGAKLRIFKRLAKGEFRRAAAVITGTRAGWREPQSAPVHIHLDDAHAN